MRLSIGDGLATKIVLVFFGKCLAREDCSGLATKIVLVDWRQRLWSSATKIGSSFCWISYKDWLFDYRQMGSLIGDGLATNIVVVLFGTCDARED